MTWKVCFGIFLISFVDLLFYMCLSLRSVMSVSCRLAVTCWERADLLALLYVMFSCAFVRSE